MTLLIIHCPLRPFSVVSKARLSYEEQLDQFEWYLYQDDSVAGSAQSFGVGNIESMPYADQVLALMPTIDVRLLETKVPIVNSKKMQQILPGLIEDQILGGVERSSIYVLPPLAGQPSSQRILAVMDQSWIDWLSQQLKTILTPRIRLIPDCLILPLASNTQASCLARKKVQDNVIYTWHQSEQVGIAWIEHQSESELPSRLKDIHPLEWSLEGMTQSALAYSQRTDLSTVSLNLLNASTTSRNPSLKLSAQWFSKLTESFTNPLNNNDSCLERQLWLQTSRWAVYSLLSLFLGWGIFSSWLTIDNWRWSRNIDISAAQFLSPDSISLLARSGENESISDTLMKELTLEARKKGFVTDADFLPMTAKLGQLMSSLNQELVEKIQYDGYHIDFQIKPTSTSPLSSEVITKAQSLGLKVLNLQNNQYRLQPYAGLGMNSSN